MTTPNNPGISSNLVFQESEYEYIDDVSNDIDGGGFSEGPEGDSDYTGDDSFDESDYSTSDDYEEVEYDYQLAEDPVPLEEVCHLSVIISIMEGRIKLASLEAQPKGENTGLLTWKQLKILKQLPFLWVQLLTELWLFLGKTVASSSFL